MPEPFQLPLLATEVADAVLSDCGTYRYRLTRRWDDKLPALGWVMLNPSTADASKNDPTIRRCIGFAKRWRYGGIVVRNLYALRATNPDLVFTNPAPVGPLNGDELALAAFSEPVTMLAWGARAPISRAKHVAKLLWLRSQIHGTRLAVLGWTKDKSPGHPLYVRMDQDPEYCDSAEVFDA
jgi:hypothetical protein